MPSLEQPRLRRAGRAGAELGSWAADSKKAQKKRANTAPTRQAGRVKTNEDAIMEPTTLPRAYGSTRPVGEARLYTRSRMFGAQGVFKVANLSSCLRGQRPEVGAVGLHANPAFACIYPRVAHRLRAASEFILLRVLFALSSILHSAIDYPCSSLVQSPTAYIYTANFHVDACSLLRSLIWVAQGPSFSIWTWAPSPDLRVSACRRAQGRWAFSILPWQERQRACARAAATLRRCG